MEEGQPKKTRKTFGPAWAVTAAFIGPGTVTTMTIAGARFGYALLWAVVLSVLVAVILQEMSGRVAIARRAGLGTVLRERFQGPFRILIIVLVVAAIFGGNAAFQMGNIAGASLGLQVMIGGSIPVLAVLVADVAFLALWFAAQERIDIPLRFGVALMGIAFVATVFLVPLDWSEIGRGLLPRIPGSGLALVLATIGTTVVPYNLFLHSSLVKTIGWRVAHVSLMRRDTVIAISVGGLLSAAILLTSGSLLRGSPIDDAHGMALGLDPLLGPFASKAFGVGLLLAGLTSAITAPFAAALALTQVLGGRWLEGGIRGVRFRGVWIAVLVAGLLPHLFGPLFTFDILALIVFAQALNGILLPLLAILLFLVANDRGMGPLRNRLVGNALGAAACLVAVFLGGRLIAESIRFLGGP